MSPSCYARLRGWGLALCLIGSAGVATAQATKGQLPPDDPPPQASQAAPAMGGIQSANIFQIAPGADTDPTVNGKPFGTNSIQHVCDGQLISLGSPESGLRSYLAVRGGIDVEPVLGSRSYDVMSAIGPRPLRAGDVLTIGRHRWQIRVGFGHSPEHAALYSADLGVLISGDMLLPKISTNISVFAVTPAADSLADFLLSIDAYRELPPETLVLPSHGLPFHGIENRVAALHAHHEERLLVLEEHCATPRSAPSNGPRTSATTPARSLRAPAARRPTTRRPPPRWRS